MAEGTTPLFNNFRTGKPTTVVDAIPAGGITTIKIADNAITTNKILNGAITNAKLADMAQQLIKARKTLSTGAPEDCTLSEILDFIGAVAHGAILFRDANATGWNFLPAGTAGQFLQTNGAGADPSWVTPTTPGGITTIASGSLSGATVSITSIPETYAYLVLQITGGSSDTANRTPLVRASTDNGATYDAVAANYPGDFWDASGAVYGSSTLASLMESSPLGLVGNTFTATLTIFNYHTGPHKLCEFRYVDTSGGGASRRGRIFYIGSTNNIDALQILWSGSGNFDAGTYALYGVQ